jgi:hypothetical protein
MSENVMYALEVMGKGMFSIFVVILILTLIVVILAKVTNLPFLKGKDTEE